MGVGETEREGAREREGDRETDHKESPWLVRLQAYRFPVFRGRLGAQQSLGHGSGPAAPPESRRPVLPTPSWAQVRRRRPVSRLEDGQAETPPSLSSLFDSGSQQFG